MPVGTDSFGGNAVEFGCEFGQVQVPVYPAELAAGIDHARGATPQRHLPVTP